MWWQYLLVVVGALLVDVSPFPSPPAFTVMPQLVETEKEGEPFGPNLEGGSGNEWDKKSVPVQPTEKPG